MAGIDKTYAQSIKEVDEFINWAEEASFKCPNGQILKVINYCYLDREYISQSDVREEMERWFEEGNEIPVLNSPTALDYFLIKYCPLPMVQKRMNEVYSEDYIKSIKDGTSDWDTFKRPTPGNHLKWVEGKPNHRKELKGWLSIHSVDLPDDTYLRYNNEDKIWIYPDELGIWNTSAEEIKCRSIKAINRKILGCGFGEGTVVTIVGRNLTKPIKIKVCK